MSDGITRNPPRKARFAVGDVVRHRYYPFRGVIFDIDPVFANTEEWWRAIPEEIRPAKDQPFSHLLAETAETEYVAYVSEQPRPRRWSQPPHPAFGHLLPRGEKALTSPTTDH